MLFSTLKPICIYLAIACLKHTDNATWDKIYAHLTIKYMNGEHFGLLDIFGTANRKLLKAAVRAPQSHMVLLF